MTWTIYHVHSTLQSTERKTSACKHMYTCTGIHCTYVHVYIHVHVCTCTLCMYMSGCARRRVASTMLSGSTWTPTMAASSSGRTALSTMLSSGTRELWEYVHMHVHAQYIHLHVHVHVYVHVYPHSRSPQRSWWGLVLAETHPAHWVTV